MLPISGGLATDLDHLYLTLRPEPLIKPAEFELYYRPQVNQVRGEDTVARLSLKLQQAFGALPFKAFLMGHPGVGKSTEISRLLQRVEGQHVGIRLSIATELNPASFKVFDVLLLMLIRLAEEADRMQAVPLEGFLSEHLVSGIQQWFGTEQVKKSTTQSSAIGVEAGAGVKGDSIWAGLLGLFASAKAEMKYAADRKTETVQHSLQRLPELVDLCNRLIDVCNQTMQGKNRQGVAPYSRRPGQDRNLPTAIAGLVYSVRHRVPGLAGEHDFHHSGLARLFARSKPAPI